MAVLVFDDAKKREIDAAVAEARAHVIPWAMLRATAVNDRGRETDMLTLADRNPGTKRPDSIGVDFEGGVTAAISFEEQPAGILRHASFATGRPGKNRLLHPAMLEELCRLFGFRDFPPRQGRVWIEEYKPDYFAVNVVEIEVEREIAGHA